MSRAIPLHSRVVTQTTGELVGEALRLMPPRVLELVGDTPVFEGDRAFAGWWSEIPATTACCYHKRVGRSVLSCVSLPTGFERTYWDSPIGVVLHEFGHALWNRLVRRHERSRVYWDHGKGEVLERGNSGLVPGFIGQFADWSRWKNIKGADPFVENFCEAFRIWLSPAELVEASWEPTQFYVASRYLTTDAWGWRFDNRRLLAWFNEIAGFERDRPPCALLSSA